MNKRIRFSLWYVLGVLLLITALQSTMTGPGVQKITYAEFLRMVESGQIAKVIIGQGQLTAYQAEAGGKPGRKAYIVNRVSDPDLVKELRAKGIDFEGRKENTWLSNFIFGWILPLGVMIAIWSLVMRRMGRGGAGVMAFGKAKARIYAEGDTKTTFDDVAGADEAKEELEEVVEFLKSPDRYSRLGGRIPKGVLLVGSPGTGKTLLAKAVAGEAKAPFYSISGSGFVEMFVGVGASRVRDLFAQATKNAPCIIFIDEIDALGRARGAGIMGGNEEREQTLNQLLAEMDGFESNKGVIILAATNRPEILDPALLRAGRFDRHVLVDRPDLNGREAILKVHSRKVLLADDVDLRVVAARTPGMVGADLANVVNEAALLAAREGKEAVSLADFEQAVDRVMAGLEKKTRVMSDKEKKIVAYHEVGHALTAESVETADKLHKVSIIPRGIGALGYTLQLPTEDRYLMTKTELVDRLAVLLGGRVAEEIVFGEVSTGTQNDLYRATDIARTMVKEYGMSDKLGLVTFERERRPLFLEMPNLGGGKDYSESTARLIDEEVEKLVEDAHQRVRDILTRRRADLERAAEVLLEKEILEGDEFRALIGQEEVKDKKADQGPAKKAPAKRKKTQKEKAQADEAGQD